MTDIPATDAGAQLADLVREVSDARGRITLTDGGRAAAVLLSAEELDELEEAAAVADYFLRRENGTQVSVPHAEVVDRLRRRTA